MADALNTFRVVAMDLPRDLSNSNDWFIFVEMALMAYSSLLRDVDCWRISLLIWDML